MGVPLLANRYDLGPVIGQGGMAQVYAARDTTLDRPVAVKVMRPEVAHQALVRERFEAEARMAARLVHPNVVSVFDSGEHEGQPYIVMERLTGETLQDRMAQGRLLETDLRTIALEVLAALEAAHAAGILHRDIKPANILAAGGGQWKVADFGIAKALEAQGGEATATGLVLGTPAYVAPERLLGAPASVTSDLYSVGVVLYEALSGRRPYDNGTQGSYPGVVSGVPLTSLASLRPGLDPVLVGTVERALAREPSDRFQSAAQMAAALRSPVALAPTMVMAPRPEPTSVLRTTEEEKRRNPAALVLGILASLIILAAIIWAVVAARHHDGSPTTSTSEASSTTSSTLTTTPASTTPTTVAPTTAAPTTAAPTTAAPTTTPPTTAAPTTPAPTTTTRTIALTLPTAAPNSQG
jgi:serine/threonine protein kinase